MKKKLLFLFIIISSKTFSQIPEDAIRYSWFPQTGTARNMAIGSAMGSLGGDITAAYVNPAGLGFYRTGEIVFSPGLSLHNNKANFRQAVTLADRKGFSLGPSGVIYGKDNEHNMNRSNAFCFAISQTANFNNVVRYKALNNYSSFAEQFAEELAKSGRPVEDYLYTNSIAPYTIAPAWNTYLIDTVRMNNVLQVRAATENILDAGEALQQELTKTTGGGIYEAALSFANNEKGKWLIGGTIGIPLVFYKSNTTFTEQDTSNNNTNGFRSFSYNDEFKTFGIGANLKLGVIYRPKEYIRLGLAIHTPSFMTLEDTRTVNISNHIEYASGKDTIYNESSKTFTNNQPGVSKYYQSSAWKAIISASYVFREVENVKKQRAFITADIEYVNHRASRFSSNNEMPTEEEKAYYKSLNKVVKQQFKGTFNFRAGGEIKFNTIMARLGFAYYGNPYKDKTFKGNHVLLSGGLGYRNKGFFIDLTYVQDISKDVNLPYRLEDRANTFASLKNKQGNILATVGVKF